MNDYIKVLEEVEAASLPLVGGKGANLGELARAGFPVPAAFCVTTEAYRKVIEANARLYPMFAELDGLCGADAADIGSRAARIRKMMISADIPPDVDDAIRSAYGRLESSLGTEVPVSVRSSATAEDLPGMSFAGQQDTYLNIRGADEVVNHVRRCWASLWTDRAISYRQKNGFDHGSVFLAVVVQEMFPSEVAGVMFTANPLTSNTGEIFLNASWGLGEAVVSGHVNPDQYIVEKGSLEITGRKIHDKQIMTVGREKGQGSSTVEVPADLRSGETLSDEKIRELCKIGLKIENHYGFPQDIEWGYAQGRFAILQAREVTGADIDFKDGLEAWQTSMAKAELTDERWVWSRAYSDEVQTGPTSPLFYTYLQHVMTSLKFDVLRWTGVKRLLGYRSENFADMPLFRWHGARAYINTAYEKERIRLFIPPFARTDAALWMFPEEEREEIRNMPFDWPSFLWTMLKLHVTHPKVSLLRTTGYVYQGFERWTDHADAVWAAIDLETATPKEIFEAESRANEGSGFISNYDFYENCTLPFSIYLYVLPPALYALCRSWLDDDGHIANRLMAGLQTKTSEANIAIWKLSRKIKRSPALYALVQKESTEHILKALEEIEEGRSLKTELDSFLKKYGHRGGAERDPIHPRWRHKPELLFHSLKPMLVLDDDNDPEKFEHRLRQLMLTTRQECIDKLRGQPLGFLTAPFFTWLLDLVQDYVYYRDYERFYNDKNMCRPRDMYTAIARTFIKRGLMTDEEDIFFLGKEEVVAAEEGRLSAKEIAVRVRSRRRVYAKYAHREPPKYIRGWETFDDDRLVDDGQGLKGIPASSGVATGRARVCRTLEEISKVEKGDILVTVATDPGWTTVFSLVGGVIVETGGVVAHAVMISREYGIPCVANLQQACELIPDGQTISIDGNSGKVIMHTQI